ncbi:MAG: type II secretion system protein [Salibacteraceae bacterium]
MKLANELVRVDNIHYFFENTLENPKPMKRTLNKSFKAFSLTELLVVLVIMGILVLIALPNFLPKIAEAKAQEAKLQLNHLYTLQRSYFFVHSKYSDSFEELGFEHAKLVDEDGNANYRVEIVKSSNSEFVATATSITDFDGDGNYNKWQINHQQELKEVIKD